METESQHLAELKELVRQNIALSQETNKMLHSMRRSAWISRAIRITWIVLLIGSSLLAYSYLQPYIDQILSIYGNLQGFQEKAGSFFN